MEKSDPAMTSPWNRLPAALASTGGTRIRLRRYGDERPQLMILAFMLRCNIAHFHG